MTLLLLFLVWWLACLLLALLLTPRANKPDTWAVFGPPTGLGSLGLPSYPEVVIDRRVWKPG